MDQPQPSHKKKNKKKRGQNKADEKQEETVGGKEQTLCHASSSETSQADQHFPPLGQPQNFPPLSGHSQPIPQQQQRFGPPQQYQQRYGPPEQYQQRYGPPQQQQQSYRPPQQQQQRYGPPQQQQQRYGPPQQQQQRFGPPQQQQQRYGPPQQQQQGFGSHQQQQFALHQQYQEAGQPKQQQKSEQPKQQQKSEQPKQQQKSDQPKKQQKSDQPKKQQKSGQPEQQQQSEKPKQQLHHSVNQPEVLEPDHPCEQENLPVQEQPTGKKNQKKKKKALSEEQPQQQESEAPQKPTDFSKEKVSSSLCLTPKLRPEGPRGYGTSGRKIRLIINHFPLNFDKARNKEITHYDVVIKNSKGNERIPKPFKRLVIMRLQDKNPDVFRDSILAFDGEKNVYSSNHTKKVTNQFEVNMSDDPNRIEMFTVKLKKVASVRLAELLDSIQKPKSNRAPEVNVQALQMLEIMFKEYRARCFVPVGRNSFFPMENADGQLQRPLMGGKLACKGFFSSLRPASWKDGSILLNFDVSNAVFFEPQPLMTYIQNNLGLRDRDMHECLRIGMKKSIDKEIRGLKVRTTHNHRTTKVVGLAPVNAINHTFPVDPNRPQQKISVQQYFQQTYRTQLRYPKFNLLHVGNAQKNTYMPIELCQIEKAQKVMKKLNPAETAAFIKTTAVPPRDRLVTSHRLFLANKFNDDPILNQLGISVAGEPLRLEGRVLDAPTIVGGRQQKYSVQNGQWNIQAYQKGGSLKRWVVINFGGRSDPMRFLRELKQTAQRKGLSVDEPLDVTVCHDFNNVQGFLTAASKKFPNLDLIVCILGRTPTDLYGTIKRVGDLELSIPTQCIRDMNVDKCNRSTIENILHKINGKLNGLNNAVLSNPTQAINFNEPCLVMGADVNHPPAGGSDTIPSVAAVVGSQNLNATGIYGVEIRAQQHRLEYIEDLREMTKNLLINFNQSTGQKPSRIIMYRDGVSESQFTHVLSYEMTKMRAACKDLNEQYKPAITFICVQKRHHTRMFPEDRRDGVGRPENVPPGTIVDRDITHPHEMDFYLVSHLGIQGTSRPTHYNILWDDSDFSMEQLQLLTYYLCHAYYRCTKAVSIPCPVYYAHLAAFRGKTYLGGEDDNSSTSSGAQGTHPLQHLVRVSRDQTRLSTRLFYI